MPYTIKEITGNKAWASEKAGPMMDYYLTVTDSQGVDTSRVTLSQKAASPAPTVGQTMDGNLDQTQYGIKFKKAFTPGGAGGGGGRPKSPAEQASIAASVALKWAIEAAEQAATFGIDDAKPQTLDEHAALLKRYANFGFNFIEKKAKAA